MPIHLAIKRSHLQCVQAILEYCEPKGTIKEAGISQKDSDNNNVLHMAAQGEIEVLSLVIDRCGNNLYNMLLDKNNAGLTAIQLAAKDKKYYQNLETLLKASKECSPPVKVRSEGLGSSLFASPSCFKNEEEMYEINRQIIKAISKLELLGLNFMDDPYMAKQYNDTKVSDI